MNLKKLLLILNLNQLSSKLNLPQNNLCQVNCTSHSLLVMSKELTRHQITKLQAKKIQSKVDTLMYSSQRLLRMVVFMMYLKTWHIFVNSILIVKVSASSQRMLVLVVRKSDSSMLLSKKQLHSVTPLWDSLRSSQKTSVWSILERFLKNMQSFTRSSTRRKRLLLFQQKNWLHHNKSRLSKLSRLTHRMQAKSSP